MIADIFIFDKPFYPLYVLAFCLEMTGVVLYSREKPIKPLLMHDESQNQNSSVNISDNYIDDKQNDNSKKDIQKNSVM